MDAFEFLHPGADPHGNIKDKSLVDDLRRRQRMRLAEGAVIRIRRCRQQRSKRTRPSWQVCHAQTKSETAAQPQSTSAPLTSSSTKLSSQASIQKTESGQHGTLSSQGMLIVLLTVLKVAGTNKAKPHTECHMCFLRSCYIEQDRNSMSSAGYCDQGQHTIPAGDTQYIYSP